MEGYNMYVGVIKDTFPSFYILILKTVASGTPYKASACHSAGGNQEAGVCCVHVDEETEERETMQGTPGADGTNVAGTVEGEASSVTLQHSVYMQVLHALLQILL